MVKFPAQPELSPFRAKMARITRSSLAPVMLPLTAFAFPDCSTTVVMSLPAAPMMLPLKLMNTVSWLPSVPMERVLLLTWEELLVIAESRVSSL